MSDRCRGHCCRGFALERPFTEVWEDYERWQADPTTSTIPDIQTLAPMLIPLKRSTQGEGLFTCKHLLKNGDCGIYEGRPQMCRDFPGPKPCPFPICATHGSRGPLRKALDWLRT